MQDQTSTRLRDKVVLITGAASGIGAAIARRVASEGAHAILIDLNRTLVDEVAGQIRADGGSAVGIEMDVTDPASVARGIETAGAVHGGLDALICNAGKANPTTLDDMTDESWDLTFAVNVRSIYTIVKAALPFMQDREDANVTLTGSVAALIGIGAQPAYVASKGAVVALARALASELRGRSIRVNSVCPGNVKTPLLINYFSGSFPDPAERELRERESYENLYPARFAEPEEIASVFAFLASTDASYVNGAAISVDAGQAELAR
jgi:3-oxoacyl-[acyl-carrier protein] reductase